MLLLDVHTILPGLTVSNTTHGVEVIQYVCQEIDRNYHLSPIYYKYFIMTVTDDPPINECMKKKMNDRMQ